MNEISKISQINVNWSTTGLCRIMQKKGNWTVPHSPELKEHCLPSQDQDRWCSEPHTTGPRGGGEQTPPPGISQSPSGRGVQPASSGKRHRLDPLGWTGLCIASISGILRRVRLLPVRVTLFSHFVVSEWQCIF